MEHWGLIKVATAVPEIVVADPLKNTEAVLQLAKSAYEQGVSVLVFPELATTGYTCADLFAQSSLLSASDQALLSIAEASLDWGEMLIFVGAPLLHKSRLYNCGFAIRQGSIVAAVPKTYLPQHGEFYEARWFSAAPPLRSELSHSVSTALVGEQAVPFGQTLINARLCDGEQLLDFSIGVEICEDLWMPDPPSTKLALAGAQLICNLSASNELVAKAAYRRALLAQQSARLNCAYLYTSAGPSESTTDLVFGGHCLLYENGKKLSERPALSTAPSLTTAVVDLRLLMTERQRNTGFAQTEAPHYPQVFLSAAFQSDGLTLIKERRSNPLPFVPQDLLKRDEQSEELLRIQSFGLAKRLKHTGIKKVVLGVSGGLDSTLALLVIVRAYRELGWPLSDVHALTLPGYGTSDRTYQNACKLMEAFGFSKQEISIVPAVEQHFKDIGHDPALHDVSYENSQARERTQILMDYANKIGALVVGTGDLSELALGWCTYNGDHMSMYGINASVPKTLVRHLVSYQAGLLEMASESGLLVKASESDRAVAVILRDILATPISPELLPPDATGQIAQLTEDSTGPYVLHDFFIYSVIRYGYGPAKTYHLAVQAFASGSGFGLGADSGLDLDSGLGSGLDSVRPSLLGDASLSVPNFDAETILKWLKKFYWRFFSQQFKRSCMPDGPQVGAIAFSPRGSWRMPSDASSALWLAELDEL